MALSRSMLFPASSLALAVALGGTLALSCKDKSADTAAPSITEDAATALPSASTVMPAAMPAASADGGGDHETSRGPHGGPGAMLFQAAHALELKDEQKAKLEAAEKAAHGGATEAAHDAMRAATKDLHADLIAGIKAGKIDTAKLEPRYAAVEKVFAEAQAKEAEALNALHEVLDATQRKAVTANARAKQATREEKMAHHEGADGGPTDGGAAGGKGNWTSKRSVDRLTRGLDLDADQQKKVDAVVAKEDAAKTGHPDLAEMKKNVESLLTAFEKDTFDAKKLAVFDAKKARGPLEQETKLLAQVVPILKPEQREKLAAKMEKGPSPHGRRPGFGHQPLVEENDDD